MYFIICSNLLFWLSQEFLLSICCMFIALLCITLFHIFFLLKKENILIFYFDFQNFSLSHFLFILRHYLLCLVNPVFFLISSLFQKWFLPSFSVLSWVLPLHFCTSFPEKIFKLWSYLFHAFLVCGHAALYFSIITFKRDLIAIILCNFLHEFDMDPNF